MKLAILLVLLLAATSWAQEKVDRDKFVVIAHDAKAAIQIRLIRPEFKPVESLRRHPEDGGGTAFCGPPGQYLATIVTPILDDDGKLIRITTEDRFYEIIGTTEAPRPPPDPGKWGLTLLAYEGLQAMPAEARTKASQLAIVYGRYGSAIANGNYGDPKGEELRTKVNEIATKITQEGTQVIKPYDQAWDSWSAPIAQRVAESWKTTTTMKEYGEALTAIARGLQ